MKTNQCIRSRWLAPPWTWSKHSVLFAVLALFALSNLLTASPQDSRTLTPLIAPADYVPTADVEATLESCESSVMDLSFDLANRVSASTHPAALIAYDLKMPKRHCWNEDATTGPPCEHAGQTVFGGQA